MLRVTYTKLDMWHVQITLAMRRCIWPEALFDPVEHAVLRHIKVRAAPIEVSLLILTPTHADSVSVALATGRSYTRQSYSSVIKNVVTLSQVLHIAQDDIYNYYSKM